METWEKWHGSKTHPFSDKFGRENGFVVLNGRNERLIEFFVFGCV